MASGLLTDEAEAEGKITLGGEFGGGETTNRWGVRHAYEGTLNVLRHYGLLDGEIRKIRPAGAPSPQLVRADKLQAYVPCPRDGVWEPQVDLGAAVEAGDVIGRLHDFSDHGAGASPDPRRPQWTCHHDAPERASDERADALCHRRARRLARGDRMKITQGGGLRSEVAGPLQQRRRGRRAAGPDLHGPGEGDHRRRHLRLLRHGNLRQRGQSLRGRAALEPRRRDGMFRRTRLPHRRAEPARSGAPLVQDVSRQHLLRAARRGDSGDLRHRHRPVGYLR